MPPDDSVQRAYAGRRVVVLGASGFIGRWVARQLTDCAAELYLVARDAARMRELLPVYEIDGVIVAQDLHDLEAVGEWVADVRPAIVFNLAGYGVDPTERDEPTAYRINAALVRTVAEALVAGRDSAWEGQALIHVGSALEYGVATSDLAEDTEPLPTTLYGQSKLAGTQALAEVCRASGLRGLTARLFTVYGPGEHPHRLLPSLLRASASGRPLDLTAGSQKRDFAFVADVAEALLRLGVAQAEAGEVVNVATGQLTAVREFTERAARILGIERAMLRFGAVPVREEEMAHRPVAVDRLKRRTGWIPPTTIEEGVRRTRAFYDARPESLG